MKTKLKPVQYRRPVKFDRVVDFHALKKRLEGFLPEKRADDLAFELMELDEVCESFRAAVVVLFKSLRSARRDATGLHDAVISLNGDLIHFRYHIRGALSASKKLGDKALTMPPLDTATDLDLTERALAPFDKLFEAAGIIKTGKGKTDKKHTKKRPSTTKTKKKRRKKT